MFSAQSAISIVTFKYQPRSQAFHEDFERLETNAKLDGRGCISSILCALSASLPRDVRDAEALMGGDPPRFVQFLGKERYSRKCLSTRVFGERLLGIYDLFAKG